MLGYTTRSNVENFLGRTFSEVGTTEFNTYITAAEKQINNYLGYNSRTTTSGLLAESVVREKVAGKIDSFANLVVDVRHGPINFDVNGNPIVSLLEFNLGSIRVSLPLTDGSSNALNTLLEVPENGRRIIYPSIYFFPAISTVTPTSKVNLFNLRDVRFWVDVSYVGGYASLPEDIQLATNYLVGDMLTNRDNPGNLISLRQGSYSVEFLPTRGSYVKGQPVNESFAIVEKLLQPYVGVTW